MTNYRHIAVAMDFSTSSIAALEKALTFKKDYDAELTIITVVDTNSFGSVEAYDVLYARQLVEQYETELEKLKAKYEPTYGTIHTKVEQGVAKKILTNIADADLIVCGATGKSAVEKWMLGSISTAIVRHSKIDVYIVRS